MAWYQSSTSNSNSRYNLLHHVEVNHAIKNPNNSIDDIFDVLKSTISEKQIRQIIYHWINSQFKESNNFQILSKFHQKLKENQLATIQMNNNNNNSNNNRKNKKTGHARKVFEIQSLLCTIFSYLDLQSWVECSQVNLQWLFDSHHPTSLTHIDTNDLCSDIKDGNANIFGIGFVNTSNFNCNINDKELIMKHNINKLTHTQSLKVSCWPRQCDQYFKNLKKFLNISKLELDTNERENVAMLMNTIKTIAKNNKDKIKKLTLSPYNSLDESCSPCKILESVFLPHLEVLILNGIDIQGLFLTGTALNLNVLSSNCNSNRNRNSYSNFNNLQHIKMDDSYLGIQFWCDMADDRINLSNITNMSFTRCKIDKNDKNIELIESNYIPKIAQKLNNLTHFTYTGQNRFRRSHDRWGSRTNTAPLGVILASFLIHLSRNGKAKKSLTNLDICLTSKWFFKQEKSVTGTKTIIYHNYVKTDQSILNFTNLHHVSITFKPWGLNNMLMKWDHSDQLRELHKALGVICCETQNKHSEDFNSFNDNSSLQIEIAIETAAAKQVQKDISQNSKNTLSALSIYLYVIVN